jgi:hypothetical protein
MHKKLFKTLLATFFISSAFSQTQSVAYPAVGKGVSTTYVTDYHCLGINNSALGWGTGYDSKRVTIGSSEFGFGMYSDQLDAAKLKNLYNAVKGNLTGDNADSVDWNKQKEMAAVYAQAGVSMFLDYNWGGFSFQGKKFGGIAFNVAESYRYYSKFNEATADIVFRGKLSSYFDSLTIVMDGDTSIIENRDDISEDTLQNVILGSFTNPLNVAALTRGSELKMVWNRSFNFGYGRKIIGLDSIFELYGGVGGRIIKSVAMFNMKSDENGMYMYSSITPAFGIDYGAVAALNPSNFTDVSGLLPKVVGDGYGVDLSVSAILFSKLKVAASVNNIGQVTYTRNVYKLGDTLLSSMRLEGMESYDVTKSIDQLISEGGIMQLVGQEKYVLKNASDFRFGASLDLSKNISFGFDMVAPFNKDNPGGVQNAIVSAGGEYRPVKWLALSAGYFGGGIYQNNIPIGVNFILKDGAYEFGISSRDAVSFFTKNGHSISSAFGFARVRF